MYANICGTALWITIGIVLTAPPPGRAEAPAAFEVASIKPAAPGGHGVRIQVTPGGRFVAKNANLKFLIQFAYGVKEFQITGGPGWVSSEAYDMEAKPGGDDRKVATDELKRMMQALLTDRFKLTFHRETKELPVYALVVGKNGPKLHQADGERGQVRMGRGQITAQKVTMADFAGHLSNRLGRNVIDRTGLTGGFDLELTWTPDENEAFGPKGGPGDGPPPSDPNGPSLFTAVQEQLGLKLEAQKGPVEVFIIDRAEKAAEN